MLSEIEIKRRICKLTHLCKTEGLIDCEVELLEKGGNISVKAYLDGLAVVIKYRMFDLEATKREKVYLEKLLQEKK